MPIIAAVIAVIIFANPYISVLDLLPDVFGCLLIWYATSHVEFFSPKIEEARRLWLKLALLTGGDLILSSVIPANDETMRLLFVFVFRIAEGVMMFLAGRETFDGIMYLGTKFDGVGIYMHDSKRKTERIEKKEEAEREKLARILEREREKYERDTADGVDEKQRSRATGRYRAAVAKISADENRVHREKDGIAALTHSLLIFVIVKTAMCVLPEFTVLSSHENRGDVTSGYDLNIANYKGMFISLGFLVALVVSIFWLVRVLRYINGIARDRTFMAEVKEKYAEFTRTHVELYTCRRVTASLIVLGLGLVFTFDFFFDYKNFVPDFIAACLFLVFFLIIPHGKKPNILGISLSAAYAVMSAAQWIYLLRYIDNFTDFTHTSSSDAAFAGYIVCCVLTALSELLFAALIVLVFREVATIINSHTGYMSDIGETDERTTYLRELLTKHNKRSFVFAMITAAASIVYMISVGINKRVLVEDETLKYYIYLPRFESMGAINTVISILFIAMTVKLISDIYDAVKERYKFL